MKKKLSLLLIVVLTTNLSQIYATVTAVLNLDQNSSTALSFLQTCSGSESPDLKVKLWNNGSAYNFPSNKFVYIQWYQKLPNGSNLMKDQKMLGLSDGSIGSYVNMKLMDEELEYTIPGSGWTAQTSSKNRYSGQFFARIKLLNYDTPDSVIYTTNLIEIKEGQIPIVKINDLYTSNNVYTVLSGCNSGNVNLKIHQSQTCALDRFTIAMWETNGHGTRIGNLFWRPLTNTEISNISGVSPSGINIQSINSNVTGGSNNGTITMANGKHYGIEFKYTGQNANLVMYLTVYYKAGTWDLVMSDGLNLDAQMGGYEPVNKWFNSVYTSPDLWNKLSTSSSLSDGQHENPDYSPTNFCKLMFKVTNIGCSTSTANTPLRLFWTRARTNELWSKHWKYDTLNNYVISTLSSLKVPAGSEITVDSSSNARPYNNKTKPFKLPPINPGSTFTVSYTDAVKWFPPDPADFGPANGSMNNTQAYPIICLLARINEKDSTKDPIVWEPTGTIDTMMPYIKNNNNIATRNSWLVNAPQHIVIGNNDGWHNGYGTILISNPFDRPIRVNICLDKLPDFSSSGSFLDHGSISLGTTDGLNAAWSIGGANAIGITQNSATSFNVTNGTHACLNNITLTPGNQEQIGFRFEFNASTLPGTSKDFIYELSQMQLDSAYSGDSLYFDTTYSSNVVYMVNVPTTPPFPPEAFVVLDVEDINQNSKVKVYPNPSSKEVTVTINGDAENGELLLYSSSGVLIKKYVYSGKARIIEIIDLSDLASGIYTIKYKNDNESIIRKISIIK